MAITNRSSIFGRTAVAAMSVGALTAVASAPAHAAGTPAGTSIDNTATATYDDGSGGTTSVDSNEVTIVVDEILNVAVTWADPGDVSVSPGENGAVLSFTVTNAGNGDEPILLSVDPNIGGDDFDPDAFSLYIDSNGNGVYDAGTDTVYDPANPPDFAPDETIAVFILGDIPAGVGDSDRSEVELTATAQTGSGTPGTVFAGQGAGGSDAVVGATGATANDSGFYAVVNAAITFTKAASVADPFGGTTQVPGSIVTFTLTASVTGSGALNNVVVTDPIPTDTTYQAGTITLDSGALTDGADADAGEFDGSQIAVDLGTVTAGTTHIIEFQVEID